MTAVFRRSSDPNLPVAVRASGCWIEDAAGNTYLDAAGGAIVVGIGHGDRGAVAAIDEQAAALSYVHATQFTTDALERYADDVRRVLPVDDAHIYPVSGGSEAVETALKMARAFHLARGEPSRHKVISRWGSYHGNTRGALDASGREPLRRPYEPWLGHAVHVTAPYEYRCPLSSHPDGCGRGHAELLDEIIRRERPENVACFIAEPVVGATLGAAVPPDDYWPAVQEVCRRYGVLLVADEVMTGFGRTGAWFGSDHWDVRPDIVAAGKGASSGYWPFGFAACSGRIHDGIAASFVHGFTYSHSPVGAAVGRYVLTRLRQDDLVAASRTKGELLLKELEAAVADHPHVGDVRGIGLMVGIELVRDRTTKQPFPRAARVTERVMSAAKAAGLLLYPSTGCVDGTNGDLVMLGPPFVIDEEEQAEVVRRTAAALASLRG